jgi:isoleucyl-tRNA synthetase
MEVLFNIDKKGSVIFINEAMDLSPELRFLNPAERLYLVLAYDYYSIYRQFPQHEKCIKSLNHVQTVLNESVITTSQKMLIAIECYKSLQYDIRREQVMVYRMKLQQLDTDLQNAASSTAIKNIMESKSLLKKAIDEMENEIETALEVKSTLRGGATNSMLEKLKLNKELYRSITSKRTVNG